MLSDNRRTIRQQLEVEVQRTAYKARLADLAVRHPTFAGFNGWKQVFDILLDDRTLGTHKDEMLEILVSALQNEESADWQTILLLAFWPALGSLARRCREWDTDLESLWDNLIWAFLAAVRALNLTTDHQGIARRLVHATHDRLRTIYRRDWTRYRREVQMTGKTQGAVDSAPSESPDDADRRQRVDVISRLVDAARSRGDLSVEDVRVLTEIDFHGMTLEEYADATGLGYEAVKKRRQRVLAKVRRVVSRYRRLP